MPWQKVSDNRWERPADGIEGYFIAMGRFSSSLCDGRVHYTLLSTLKIETGQPDTTVVPALKRAWKQSRYEQPHLASVAATEGDMRLIYEVPNDNTLDEWLESTFIVSSASDAENLYSTVEPISRATLYYLPKSSELVLRIPHYIIDGNGMLRLWHIYLKALESPIPNIKFGDEPARLPLPMEEVHGFSKEETPEMMEKATAKFMSWAGSVPGIGPVSGVGTAPSGRCRQTEIRFPANTTGQLVAACKRKGVTITAAVHAAYIGAIVKYADPKGKLSEYVTPTQFNLRRYMPEPDSERAVAVYYTPWPYKIDLPAPFWDVAKSLQQYYQTEFNDHREWLEIRGHFARVLTATVQTPEFLASPPPRDALVSSLGIVESLMQRTYGGFEVKDLMIGVDVVLGMSMFFMYTFQDQLRLNYSFNDGFEKPEAIEMYLDEMRAILVRELLT
ncbi:hypothetical protein F4821DRAFT_248095 [Hypoxylon rubiginosum]|uniref:Uncharacterized protein n=1 Tax=Hypoxylon rubiginosum TaxID=110542 RepID=A0ACC0CNN1_9PEZI|nr:hypothetical protein F4821DRAFT_248095 [Hypoxylon rubiginosum]